MRDVHSPTAAMDCFERLPVGRRQALCGLKRAKKVLIVVSWRISPVMTSVVSLAIKGMHANGRRMQPLKC